MKNRFTTTAVALALLYAGTTHAFGPGDAERGKMIFNQRCAVCHGEDGRGKNGMAADFVGEWNRLGKPVAELARNIRSGYQTPGKMYTAGSCPAQPFTDRDMEDVLAHMRTAFGPTARFK